MQRGLGNMYQRDERDVRDGEKHRCFESWSFGISSRPTSRPPVSLSIALCAMLERCGTKIEDDLKCLAFLMLFARETILPHKQPLYGS
jgi:hypothetical protein